MEYFHQILIAYTVLHCLDTGIQNKDKASPSISEASHGKLVKMRTTLEPRGLFWSNFAYLYILTLSRHLYAKRRRCFAEHGIF